MSLFKELMKWNYKGTCPHCKSEVGFMFRDALFFCKGCDNRIHPKDVIDMKEYDYHHDGVITQRYFKVGRR